MNLLKGIKRTQTGDDENIKLFVVRDVYGSQALKQRFSFEDCIL